MKLHSGNLFWDDTIKNAEYLELQGDNDCDVTVIGGGMSGALISHALIEEGLKVVVLDKRTPGYGSSDGNTGIIQYNSDKSLDIMIEDFGEQWAVDFYRFSLLAMAELGRIARSLDLDVGYEDTQSLFLASRKKDLKAMKKNYEALKKYDFPVAWIDKETLETKYHLKAHAALKTWQDAGLNPFKMVQALHTKNLKNGGRIYRNAEALAVEENAQGFIVKTEKHRVKCKYLVLATGYEKDVVKLAEPYAERNSTFSLVTKPIKNFWGNKEMIWDSADPYIYFRATEQDRIIAGGLDQEGEELYDQKKIDKMAKKIQKQMQAYYPALDTEIDYAWQSVFGESKDGIPFIGRYPDNPNKFYALGFGGNGTCYSVIASMIIREYIKGNTHPYAYTTDIMTRKHKGKK